MPRRPAARRPAKPAASLREVIAAGDRRASLIALRDELAKRLQDAERDVAPISRQLLLVLRELDQLPTPAEESKVDELANRRARRRAAGQ